jgi:hypothetical protein
MRRIIRHFQIVEPFENLEQLGGVMDLASIKAALNHRGLTQAEQWALVAEMRRSQDERDALAAQVAALVQALQLAHDEEGVCSCEMGRCVLGKKALKAAAARYLAADRVAVALDRQGTSLTPPVQDALDHWRYTIGMPG